VSYNTFSRVFLIIFSMEKCDIGWGDFLEFSKLFFYGEMWCGMLIEFLELFSIEKCDVAWGDFHEFLELILNREMWLSMRWYDMLLEFLELFFNEESWCGMRWFS
jgi:hypothetical protein